MSSPTLADKVAQTIYSDILNGELAPGQKLVVAELKEKYQVGASPIREALVQLSWQKCIEFKPQKGCWVAETCFHELQDLLTSLEAIFPPLIKQSIASKNQEWERKLLNAYHQLAKLQNPSQAGIKVWLDGIDEFYQALLDGCETQTLYEFCTTIIKRLMRYRYLALRYNVDDSSNINDFDTILRFALNKQSDDVIGKIKSIIEKDQQRMVRALSELNHQS